MTLNGYDSAVTGPRGIGKTRLCKLVGQKHESLLSDILPGWTCVFLPSPVGALPLPPLDGVQECVQYARAKLLANWGVLYANIIHDHMPILKRRAAGEKILSYSDGLGCDVAVDATAYSTSPEGFAKAMRMQHMIVDVALRIDGIVPPVYYRLMASEERVDSWMLQRHPETENVPRDKRLRFIQHQSAQERRVEEAWTFGVRHDWIGVVVPYEERSATIVHRRD